MDLATRLHELLGSHDEVVCAYLFGSRARGSAQRGSDVDLAVLLADEPRATFSDLPLDLEGEIEQALGLPVQITVLDRAPADLVHRVLRHGVLVLDRDPACRVRFEVRRRNEFFDMQPIWRAYRRLPPAGARR